MAQEQPSARDPAVASQQASQRVTPGDARQGPEPLTGEWVSWLASKVSTHRADPERDLIIQHRVVDADGSEFCWHVRLQHGEVAVIAGLAPEESSGTGRVTFTSDRQTAAAIAGGESSAALAVLAGKLRIDGDARLLISAMPAMEALGAALDAPA